MSFESRTNFNEENNSTVSYQRRDTYFGSVIQTTSIVKNLRQLQTDLHLQHQHDKEALIDLNQRFQLLIDRIQLLKTQNIKYLTSIADLRRKYSGVNIIDVQSEENYLSLKSNYSSISNTKIDYEWDIELYQLQISIYQKLIDIEQQTKDNRILLLEDELKQSASILITLRSSFAELQREVEYLYGQSEDLLKQYLILTNNWCKMKKEQKKWYLNIEILKNSIGFYKNIRSQSTQQYDYTSIQSVDSTQYWTLELDKVVKKIRQDFEAFYAGLYHEMTVYYETQTEELEINIKQSLQHQQIETEQFLVIQEKLQIEYEKIQKNYTYEKEILIQLESTHSSLEAEYKSIQFQNQERLEIQSNDLQNLQETIGVLAYDVDEIRRSKSSLEIEIIIYRQLLECCGIEVPTVITHRTHTGEISAATTTVAKMSIKKEKKGFVSIKECAPNGAYISLINSSSNRYIDISKWVLKQNINSTKKILYTIPDGVRLEPGSELRIYAKSSASAVTTTIGSIPYQILVNNDQILWGAGGSIETYLFNQNGVEEATYLQSVAF